MIIETLDAHEKIIPDFTTHPVSQLCVRTKGEYCWSRNRLACQADSSATIMLLNAKDSSLVNFASTDVGGGFEIKNVNQGSYFLKITFIGLKTYMKTFKTSPDNPVLDAGRIKLLPVSTELEAVTITAEKAQVVVKRDTIEYNATTFKTKANATVEDLLKKMPGLEVGTDGTVTAQGEQVQKVLVDGREFFGRDPKLATRNLPADAIEKVQVFDKKSDQAAFTGIEDGQREKTINLELKEEKKTRGLWKANGWSRHRRSFQGEWKCE